MTLLRKYKEAAFRVITLRVRGSKWLYHAKTVRSCHLIPSMSNQLRHYSYMGAVLRSLAITSLLLCYEPAKITKDIK